MYLAADTSKKTKSPLTYTLKRGLKLISILVFVLGIFVFIYNISRISTPLYTVETLSDGLQGSSHQYLDSLVNELSRLLPQNLSQRYTNPCWNSTSAESHTHALRCFPAFFLLGYPKCGTTELFKILQLHHQFASPLKKEPHWWANSDPSIISNLGQQFSNYLHNFDIAASAIEKDPRKITGDFSASTAWKPLFGHEHGSSDFPPYSIPYVFSKLFPHLKFIVIMHNPIDRPYSWFWYSCKLKHIDRPTNLLQNGPKIFEVLMEQVIQAFKKCKSQLHNATDSDYRCSWKKTLSQFKVILSKESRELVQDRKCGGIHLEDSLYFYSLKRWLQFIPREKFLILRTEDLEHDSASTAQLIFQFLGLEKMEESKLKRGLEVIGRANAQPITRRLVMTNSSRQLLTDFFKPYNKLLAQLLQDERLLWT